MNYVILFISVQIIYSMPFIRLLLTPLGPRRYGRVFRCINLWLGRIEWAVHGVRDTLFLGYFFFLLLNDCLLRIRIAQGVQTYDTPAGWLLVAWWITLIGISCWVWRDIHRHRVRLLEYARRCPRMHPREYFHAYFAGCGPLPLGFPEHPPVLQLPVIDFRRGANGVRRLWPVLHGMCSTYFIATQVVLARKRFGLAAATDIVDGLMAIWGARMLMLSRCRVTVEGVERLVDLRGPALLCCTHKSTLDFAITPALLGLVDLPHRKPFSIRYLVAKDHFLDNWFLYRGISIGRAAESAGMIFVNRRGTPEERHQAIPQAVEQLVARGVDVAIYPQGTRAPGNVGRNGERCDAGYFTAGGHRRLETFGGHLKKGAAHLAIAAAQRLAATRTPFYVVPIALNGPATAFPKGICRVQTGAEIKVVIGDPLLVRAHRRHSERSEESSAINSVHHYIDLQLEQLSGLRHTLSMRFLTDIRRFLPAQEVEDVAVALQKWQGELRLIFAILDGIYAHRPHTWQPWLRSLAEALHHAAPHEVLEALYQQVVKGL